MSEPNPTERYRIVIFTAFFEEHIGYQEVQLARVLHRSHHEVMVVSTDRSNFDPEMRYTTSVFPHVRRIKKLVRIKNTFLPLESIAAEMASFDPHVALVIHPNAGLPYFYLSTLPRHCRVISFFGDLQVHNKLGKASGIKGNRWIQRYLKDRWYQRTFDRSEIIVGNTNETIEILKGVAGNPIGKKVLMPGLGYDPEIYYYSDALRQVTRDALGIPQESILLLTTTRVYPGKPVQDWVGSIADSLRMNPRLIYVWVGFMETDFSRRVRKELEILNLGRQLRLLDFASAEYTNALFNAADYSVWFIPTISIQQSMATGLPALIALDKTVDHLVVQGVTGLYYNDFSELNEIISKLDGWRVPRPEIASHNQRYAYPSIIADLFSRLNGVSD